MSWITGCSLSPQQFPLPPSHGLFIFHLCFPGSQGPHILHQADRQQVTPSPTVGAVLCLVTRSCLTLCDPEDCSPPGSFVHGNSPRQEYCSGLPHPPPGNLPNPDTEPRSPSLQADSLPSKPSGKPMKTGGGTQRIFSRGSSQLRNGTRVSCIAGRFFTS